LVPSSIDELAANGSQSLLGLGLRFSNRIGFGDLLIARFLDPGRAESWNNTMGLFSSFHRLPLFSF
jgi:hypothetical protein